MLVSTQDMLRRAWEGGYAIPSPDFLDSNSARAYCQVAGELKAPLILSFAEVHLEHLALDEAAELVADDDACCPPHPATHSAAQTTSTALSNNVSVLFIDLIGTSPSCQWRRPP